MAFAHVMEAKLEQNRHKVDREGRIALSLSRLYELLLQEVDELDLAISNGDANAVAEEAADVANFAMMIADKFAHQYQQPNAELSEPGGPSALESGNRVAPPGFDPVTGSGTVQK